MGYFTHHDIEIKGLSCDQKGYDIHLSNLWEILKSHDKADIKIQAYSANLPDAIIVFNIHGGKEECKKFYFNGVSGYYKEIQA